MIFVGAGGHAFSLAEFASHDLEGYIAREPNSSFPFEWFGRDEEAQTLIDQGKNFHITFIYSGLPVMEKRGELIQKYKDMGCVFQTLIAPTAIVTPGSVIGEGCGVMHGSIVNRAKLGENCVVNSGAIVEHDCLIGDNTFIGPGVVIGGFTEIGKNCFIGLGARIGNGLKIGPDISVAMGAVVNKDLLEPGIYHGSPLRLFKIRRK